MKKNFKLLTVSAAILLGIGGLTSCNGDGNGDDPNTIVVAGPGAQQTLIEELISDFKKQNEEANNYNWVFRDMGEDQVEAQVPDPAAGPEIFHFASDKLANLFKLNMLQGIDKDSETGKWISENNTETGAAFADFAGKYYGYPYAQDNTYVLFYDKSVLTEEDVSTWENLTAKLKTLSDSSEEEATYQVAYPYSTAFYGAGIMFTFGSRYEVEYDQTTGALTNVTADFNDPVKGVKAGKAFIEIGTNSYVLDSENVIPTSSGNEHVVASVTGTWYVNKITAELGDNYAVAKLPTITVDGDTQTLGSFLGAKLMGVNSAAIGNDIAKTELCNAFCQFATSAEAQTRRHELYGTGGTNIEFRNSDAFKNDLAQVAVANQEATNTMVLQTNVPGKLWDAFTTLGTDIKAGNTTETNLFEKLTIANNAIQTSR